MDPVVEYLEALQTERGASRNTVLAYRRDLADFGRYLAAPRRSLAALTTRDVSDYLLALRRRGLGARERGATAFRAAGPLPASAPRGLGDPRSHRAGREPAPAAPAAAHPVHRGCGGADRDPRHHAAGRPARPGDAGVDVRVGDARLRGARAAARGPEPLGGLCGLHGEGESAEAGAGRRSGDPVGAAVSGFGTPRRAQAARPRHAVREPEWPVAVAPGAVGHPQAVRAPGRSARLRVAPHPAPLVREPPARARRRPPIGTGDARPRRYLDHADLHPSALRRGPRHVPQVPPPRPAPVARRS